MKWLGRLFGMNTPAKPRTANAEMLQDWYIANAKGHASYCLARGRYELALKFHRIDIDNYKHVVDHPEPGDTREDRKAAREYLKSGVLQSCCSHR